MGNCYKTKEEAEKALEIKIIDTELRRYALEHNERDIDWENENQFKYAINYNRIEDEFGTFCWLTTKIPNQIYFSSKEIAMNAIEAIGVDRVREWAKA